MYWIYKLKKHNSNHKTSHTYIKTNIAYTSMQRKHANANIHQHQRNTIIRLIYYVLANNLQYIRDSMLSPPTSPPKKSPAKHPHRRTSPGEKYHLPKMQPTKDLLTSAWGDFCMIEEGTYFSHWGGEFFFYWEETIVCIFSPLTSWVYVRKFQATCENWWLCSCWLILWSSCKRDHYLGGGA